MFLPKLNIPPVSRKMRLLNITALVFFAALLAVALFGQDKPTPKLNAEVHLDLIHQQNDIYRLALKMKDVEAQYIAMREELTKRQVKLDIDTKAAIAKSGLDSEKYEINAETFEVTPKLKVDAK